MRVQSHDSVIFRVSPLRDYYYRPYNINSGRFGTHVIRLWTEGTLMAIDITRGLASSKKLHSEYRLSRKQVHVSSVHDSLVYNKYIFYLLGFTTDS